MSKSLVRQGIKHAPQRAKRKQHFLYYFEKAAAFTHRDDWSWPGILIKLASVPDKRLDQGQHMKQKPPSNEGGSR
jgi:hypothetical protein